MTDRPRIEPYSQDETSATIDRTVAHPARVYDYLLGGSNNFAPDRELAKRSAAAVGGIENARNAVRANRRFLVRAVRRLVLDHGIRQFLDIGTGIPNADNVHAVAQETAPDCRIVYVDNDPIVLAHAHALLSSTPEGATDYIPADLRDPDGIVGAARATLDFTQPIALLLVSLLHFFPDDTDPYGVVARLVDTLAPGSYLVISHLTHELQADEMARLSDAVESDERSAYTFSMRNHDEIARFFDGLDLLPPGLVPIDRWHEDEPVTRPPGVGEPPFLGAIGHKP